MFDHEERIKRLEDLVDTLQQEIGQREVYWNNGVIWKKGCGIWKNIEQLEQYLKIKLSKEQESYKKITNRK